MCIRDSYQGVIAAETGHVSSHEAGAIEAGGHKVLTIPQTDGKISAEKVEEVLNTFKEDGNRDHMVMPGMVYISQPTEYGTLYNRQELEALSKVCRSNGIPLYLDGARPVSYTHLRQLHVEYHIQHLMYVPWNVQFQVLH